jgi:hypothetical protein
MLVSLHLSVLNPINQEARLLPGGVKDENSQKESVALSEKSAKLPTEGERKIRQRWHGALMQR